MTVPSFHLEAKKLAYRQSRDGFVISFVVHPSDMPDALAVAPLGQRYMLALAAIGDDEKPIPVVDQSHLSRVNNPGVGATPAAPSAGDAGLGRTVGSIPATGANHFLASKRGRARYASASDMERARTRAALLPKDARFQQWVIDNNTILDDILSDEEAATVYIRNGCCAGESRKLIAEDEACYRAFIAMETQYLIETNQMAEPR
jgi:hypothetical protein